MKERPIPFIAPMVRAILEGRKTQTRRVIQIPRRGAFALEGLRDGGWWPFQSDDGESTVCSDGIERPMACPFGAPGDRLWVKESIRHLGTYGALELDESVYVADGEQTVADAWPWKLKTLPAMFCPKGLSRLLLEVKAVRVERLQEITARDVLAEGAVDRPHTDQFGKNPVSAFDGKVYLDLRSLWRSGWDSINAKRGHSWESNPWVWVVEFERVMA